jgi:glutamate dehydrogenase/leucine dehydrogenase
MESLLKRWDGESVIARFDRAAGAWVFIAIHSTVLGPATGGTRMKTYPSPEAAFGDALKLAAGMTYKFAVSDVARGGGKAVICIPGALDTQARSDLLRRYGKLVHQLGGLFNTGPDVGTSSADMDIIAQTGAPFVFCRTPAAGGAGSSGPITALGVFTGIQAACEHVFGEGSLKGRRVLVQGAGSVGAILIDYLRAAQAEVLFSDVDEAVIGRLRDELGLAFIADEAVYRTECDIFAPCALGGVLNEDTIPRLKCRVVAGGANNQLAVPGDAENLRARGILYAPDYVINLGAAMAIPGIESLGWSQVEAEKRVAETIRGGLRRVFELADKERISTEAAARRIAEERLAEGMRKSEAKRCV